MLQSIYSELDKKKKAVAVEKLEPLSSTFENKIEADTNLKPEALKLPVTSESEKQTFGEKANSIYSKYAEPVIKSGMNIFQRENTEAQSSKESDMMGVNTTLNLAKAGMTVGGPIGAVAGGAIGAIYSVFKSRKDKRARQRRVNNAENKKLNVISAERDRDNLLAEAQESISAQQKVTQAQMGLIANY